MTHLELLASEARRLFDLYIEAEVAYHSAPIDDHRQELNRVVAAEYASRIVARERAHAIAYPSRSAESHLREAVESEHNRLVHEHLEDVLEKLLALSTHATTNACDGSSAA